MTSRNWETNSNVKLWGRSVAMLNASWGLTQLFWKLLDSRIGSLAISAESSWLSHDGWSFAISKTLTEIASPCNVRRSPLEQIIFLSHIAVPHEQLVLAFAGCRLQREECQEIICGNLPSCKQRRLVWWSCWIFVQSLHNLCLMMTISFEGSIRESLWLFLRTHLELLWVVLR